MNRKVYSIGALLIVYFLWGGTYLGIRFAVQTIPPFLMAGTRFLVAGLAVYLYSRCTGATRPGKAHWIDATLVGALLLAGNGLVSWAEQMVSSSVAALLIATVPLWMILMGLLGRHGTRPKPFVNPVVAVFLGWLLAHEQLTARSVWATVVIILSVVIITVSKNLETAAARRA